MLAVSTPACRSVIAVVCRSVCGDSFFDGRVAQARAAVEWWAASLCSCV